MKLQSWVKKESIFSVWGSVVLSVCLGLSAQAAPIPKPIDATTSLLKLSVKDGKELDVSVVMGSGAFHYPEDESNIIYTISDVGPAISCKKSAKYFRSDFKQMCQGDKGGKIYLKPDFSPTIFKLRLGQESFEILDRIELKDQNSELATGLTNPLSNGSQNVFDVSGNPIAKNSNGVDPEALVRLSDGSFWLGEEFAPSLVHVAANGEILERLVPKGLEKDLAGANYQITGILPALLASRKVNRGIEAVAISPDEKFLFFAMQSPLMNPDKKAYKSSRTVRLFKMDRENRQIIGEYAYQLNEAKDFTLDPKAKQTDIKVSEMFASGHDQLVILERADKTTKLFNVSLSQATNLRGSKWSEAGTLPSLEQLRPEELLENNILPVSKDLFFDSAKYPDMPTEVEGLAFTDDRHFVLVNDNDYGLTGSKTLIYRFVKGN